MKVGIHQQKSSTQNILQMTCYKDWQNNFFTLKLGSIIDTARYLEYVVSVGRLL